MDVDSFLDACRVHDGSDPPPHLRELSEHFLREARQSPSLFDQAASCLATLPVSGAGWLAIMLGTCVEYEPALAARSAPAVLSVLNDWLSQLPAIDDEAASDEMAVPAVAEPASAPGDPELLDALPYLCQCVVAHLLRLPALRQERGTDAAWMNHLSSLQEHSHGISWVLELLNRRSGDLVLLHPTSGQGARVRYENVSNCFHLFSLIQSEVGRRIEGGQDPDEAVAASARGESDVPVSDEAWWHYGDPRSPLPDLTASIWGEASVQSIPTIRDVQVILLWPPQMGRRSWHSGFFTPRIEDDPQSLTWVAALTSEECRQWMNELGLPPRG